VKPVVPFALIVIAGLAAAAGVAGASAPAHTASSTPPCVPKISGSGAHMVVDYCGPATATIKIAGRTFSFKDGYCATDVKAHFPLKITLGVIDAVKSPVNGGDPLFELNDVQETGLSLVNVNADYGGKVLDSIGTVKLKGSIPEDGTFTSTGFAKPSFSGTWNCNHVVVAQP